MEGYWVDKNVYFITLNTSLKIKRCVHIQNVGVESIDLKF